MKYLNRVILASFCRHEPLDDAYLADKLEELEGLDQWDAMGYLRKLDGQHLSDVAALLGVSLADLRTAMAVHSAVLHGRAFSQVADLTAPTLWSRRASGADQEGV